jgi:hypothetical protein
MQAFTRDQVIFSKGVVASLMLHATAIGLLLFFQPSDSLPDNIVPEKPREYIFVTIAPRPSPEIPAAATTEVLPTPASGTNDPSQAKPLEELEPDESNADDTAPAAAAAEQIAGSEPPPDIPPGVPQSDLPGTQPGENAGTRGISAGEINNSVTAYVTNYKRSLTGEWLGACLQYQNEHGVKTCPPVGDGKSETTRAVNETTSRLFSTYVSGIATNIRASRKLLAEMEAARSFMNDDSVMGELARQRYQLAEANYCRLNSCRAAAVNTSGSFATLISNEGSIKILSIGSGGMSGVLPNLMSLAIAPTPKATRLFIPYRFTATRTQQAESEDEFKVKAPVFPVTR